MLNSRRRTGFFTAGGTDRRSEHRDRTREDVAMAQLSGGFEMMSWDETLYDKAEGHPKFAHVRATHALHGHIEGEASVCYLMAYRPDATAAFVGLVMVTGAVSSEEGTFLMYDAGTFENGVAKGRWQILPGFGTG